MLDQQQLLNIVLQKHVQLACLWLEKKLTLCDYKDELCKAYKLLTIAEMLTSENYTEDSYECIVKAIYANGGDEEVDPNLEMEILGKCEPDLIYSFIAEEAGTLQGISYVEGDLVLILKNFGTTQFNLIDDNQEKEIEIVSDDAEKYIYDSSDAIIKYDT